MALWGTSTSDEAKPKYLTAEEKKNTFADDRGWVYRHANGNEEVLVAVGKLAGTSTTTGLGAATISSVKFITSALADGDTVITVDVVYNEGVTVDVSGGVPTIVVTNDDTSGAGNGNYTLAYTATGSTKNRKRFTATGLTISATDVLSIGAQNVALNSGTMVDTASTSVAAGVAISAAVGTAAGTVTVSA